MPFRKNPGPESLSLAPLPVAEVSPKVMGTSIITCENPLVTPIYPTEAEFEPIVIDLASIQHAKANPNGYLDPLTTSEAFSKLLLNQGYQPANLTTTTPAEKGLFDTLVSYLEKGIKSHFIITSPSSVEIPDEVENWDTAKILVGRMHALNAIKGPKRQPSTLSYEFNPIQQVTVKAQGPVANGELAATSSDHTSKTNIDEVPQRRRLFTERRVKAATTALIIAGAINDRRRR